MKRIAAIGFGTLMFAAPAFAAPGTSDLELQLHAPRAAEVIHVMPHHAPRAEWPETEEEWEEYHDSNSIPS